MFQIFWQSYLMMASNPTQVCYCRSDISVFHDPAEGGKIGDHASVSNLTSFLVYLVKDAHN